MKATNIPCQTWSSSFPAAELSSQLTRIRVSSTQAASTPARHGSQHRAHHLSLSKGRLALSLGVRHVLDLEYDAKEIVRATAGQAVGITKCVWTGGGSKVSLLLSSRLRRATYLAGDPKRKE